MRPVFQVELAEVQAELAHDREVPTLLLHHQRDVPDVGHVAQVQDAVGRDVAEERELVQNGLLEGFLASAREHVRGEARGPQRLHGVLRGFRFLLAHGAHDGHERDVDEAEVLRPDAPLELAQRLDERHRLDVADGAAELDDAHIRRIGLAVHRDLRHALDPLLDLVRDMRDHLHGLAQVLALALLRDDALVNLAGGDVVVPRQSRIHESLVVAQVQVGFAAVVQNEHLAVLERGHRAGVDVDVRVDLDGRHAPTPGAQKHADAARGDAFAEAGDHACVSFGKSEKKTRR